MANSHAFLSRGKFVAAAAVLAVTAVLPVALFGRAEAGQVTARSIQLSNSASSATGVTYKVTFTVATTTTVRGVVVDFCNSATGPIIGTSCTAPTGFTVGGSPSITVNSGITGSWTAASLNSGRTLTITKAAGDSLTGGSSVVSFDINSVVNPSTVGSFYGRILTYADDDDDGDGCSGVDDNPGCYAAGGNERVYIDYGGVALSTTNNLTVTARVQEQLTFCVYTSGTTCAGATGSSIDIPDATTPLGTAAVSTNNSAKFNVASNALSGVAVRMWSNNGNNGVLTSGSFTITAFGPTVDDTCTADSTNTSTEQFGLRITAGTGVTAIAPYNCAAGNHGWDADSAAGSAPNDTTTVGSAYGDTVATTSAPNDESQSTLEFAAKSALTTEAGIYQSVLNFIATGTY